MRCRSSLSATASRTRIIWVPSSVRQRLQAQHAYHPKRRAVGLTAAVARSAAGALAYVGVHKANNLASTLDELKERGVWLFGAEADGTVGLYDAPFDRPTAIIIGSEGQGLSRLTRDKCDYIVSIPMRGRVNSLNASNAAAVLLFEALRRRTQGN